MKLVYTDTNYHGVTFFRDPDMQVWRISANLRSIHRVAFRDIDRMGLFKRIILDEEPRNETG